MSGMDFTGFNNYAIETCKEALLSESRQLLGLPKKDTPIVPIEYEYTLELLRLNVKAVIR